MIRLAILILILINFTSNSIAQVVNSSVNDTINRDQFIHRTTVLSALIPGAGQIHNNKIKPVNIHSRLWWKLPIIYGGISSATYFFIYNLSEHSIVKNERLNRIDGSLPNYYSDYSDENLKIIQELYRRRRDLSFIAVLGIYTLQLIDANVEAHLFLFDSSDNLSLNINALKLRNTKNGFIPQLTMTYRFNKQKTRNTRLYN
jgi:hypothetical protein